MHVLGFPMNTMFWRMIWLKCYKFHRLLLNWYQNDAKRLTKPVVMSSNRIWNSDVQFSAKWSLQENLWKINKVPALVIEMEMPNLSKKCSVKSRHFWSCETTKMECFEHVRTVRLSKKGTIFVTLHPCGNCEKCTTRRVRIVKLKK